MATAGTMAEVPHSSIPPERFTRPFYFGHVLLAVGILAGGFEINEVKVSDVSKSVRIFAGLVGPVFIALGF